MPPLRELLLAATETLTAAGIPRPADDVDALIHHVAGAPAGSLDDLTAEQAASFTSLVSRRATREPLPHLTGTVRFRGVALAVGPGVFVPQPETSPVVSWAVAAVRSSGVPQPLIVDLCTGAGTVAFALANELPHARVHAVERDPGAMVWAERNAEARAAAGDTPVTLHLGDVEGCLPELDGSLDLVASNPPYVATSERHIPDPEVIDHDPAIALWAGDDGLDVVRLIEAAARRLLRPGGRIVVEHSDRQGRSAPAVFTEAGGWTEVTDHRDHEGLDRFVTARWVGAGQVSSSPARSHATSSRTTS